MSSLGDELAGIGLANTISQLAKQISELEKRVKALEEPTND